MVLEISTLVFINAKVKNINSNIYWRQSQKYYKQNIDNITQQPIAI
jgi:hypothetical protein